MRVCEGLATLAREFTVDFRVSRRSGGGERMILAIWARAAGTFDALLALADRGFGEQVGMLSRTLFEAAVDAYWVAGNSAEAERLAVLQFRQTRLLTAERWNKNERRDGDPSMPLLPEDLKERDKLAKLFGTKGQRHWSCLGLPDRITAVERSLPQEKEGELRARYEEDNMLANYLLHGTAVALNDRLGDSPDGGLRLLVGATGQHLPNGLRHGFWSYQRLSRLIAARHSPDRADTIDEVYREGWPLLQTLTVPSLKAAGRNGPCPCGSGRKVKDCHGGL
jgi:SEC-C motif